MKCLVCGADTKVLETRYKSELYRNSRKRRCEADPTHEFFTEEIPRATLKGLAGPMLYEKELKKNLKGARGRVESKIRLVKLEEALAAGKTVAECMTEFKLCESYIRKKKAVLKKSTQAGGGATLGASLDAVFRPLLPVEDAL